MNHKEKIKKLYFKIKLLLIDMQDYKKVTNLEKKNHEKLVPRTYKEYLQINSMKASQFKIRLAM